MIQRRKFYGKQAPTKDAHKIYILCEGVGTEPDYLEFFTNLSSNLQLITIKPEHGTDPLKLMERAREVLLDDFRAYTLDYLQGDSVWFVIDTDTWEREGKIDRLREFCRQQNNLIKGKYDEAKTYEAWKVAQSNPCFEIWLYYHHFSRRPEKEEVENYTSFKAYVDSLLAGGFNNHTDPRLLAKAIDNAEANFISENEKVGAYSTEMYLLGKEIISFVKTELNRLKSRLG
jgi:hypothetical protein